MGDTGSLALGGALGAIAVAIKHEIVLAIVGGLFVVEALSVIIQVVYFKRTGRRVFLMAPIHHHFEKKGWAEPQIVIRFWIICADPGDDRARDAEGAVMRDPSSVEADRTDWDRLYAGYAEFYGVAQTPRYAGPGLGAGSSIRRTRSSASWPRARAGSWGWRISAPSPGRSPPPRRVPR